MEFISLANGKKIANVSTYVKDYLDKYADEFYIEVIVGTDSQNRKRSTEYATVIFMHRTSYESGMGKGGSIVYRKESLPRKYSKSDTDRKEQRKLRLLSEVHKSIEVADELRNNGIKVEHIDIDINPNPMFKSNEVLQEAQGWASGMGYNVRIKPDAVSASYAADRLVK